MTFSLPFFLIFRMRSSKERTFHFRDKNDKMNLKINLSPKTPWRRPSNRFALSGVMSSLWSTVTYTEFMILVLKGKEKTCLLDRLWKIIAKNTTRTTAKTTLNAIPTFFLVEELRDFGTAGISVTSRLLQRNSNTIIRLVPTVRVKQTSMNNTDHSRWRHAANLMSNNLHASMMW